MVYLSPREQDVLKLVADGKTNKAIGIALGISEYTVRNYMGEIRRKFNTNSRAEAVAVAIRAGII